MCYIVWIYFYIYVNDDFICSIYKLPSQCTVHNNNNTNTNELMWKFLWKIESVPRIYVWLVEINGKLFAVVGKFLRKIPWFRIEDAWFHYNYSRLRPPFFQNVNSRNETTRQTWNFHQHKIFPTIFQQTNFPPCTNKMFTTNNTLLCWFAF